MIWTIFFSRPRLSATRISEGGGGQGSGIGLGTCLFCQWASIASRVMES